MSESSCPVNRVRFAVAALALLAACGQPSTPSAGPAGTALTAFAAASLQPPFDEIGAKLLSAQNIATTFRYAGARTLTPQQPHRPPAHVCAPADVGTARTTEVH